MHKVSLLVAAASVSAFLTAPARSADNACIPPLAAKTQSMASSFFAARRGVDNSAVAAACAALNDVASIETCLRSMKNAHDASPGGLNILGWDRLRVRMLEIKNLNTCVGVKTPRALPAAPDPSLSVYEPSLRGYMAAMRTSCAKDLSVRNEAIYCMADMAQASVALSNHFMQAMELSGDREAAVNVDANCDPLSVIRGKFETVLPPVLTQAGRCISSMYYYATGEDADIVTIGHGLAGPSSNQADPQFESGMREIAARVLRLNLDYQ